tara:strand:+ start:607 stop:1251 length:645 start_codon:yes stop_codon:yes gene_type:complete
MNDIESISLDISNYWISNEVFQETNTHCGTLVAFDWYNGYLSEINTNIDLDDLETDNFKFDSLINFINDNSFDFILGLRNVRYKHNPSKVWTNKLKENLKENNSDYDEYIIPPWPMSIPSFDVPENVFILRYSYDEYNKVDKLASNNKLFKNWIVKTDWEEYYKYTDDYLDPELQSLTKSDVQRRGESNPNEKTRVIVFVSDVENLVLHKGYTK